MNYKESTLTKYLEDLAAKLPAPGGGSAAALSAALGAALITMVVNFTLGKPKYLKYEKDLQFILKEAEALRLRFLDLVDLDVVAYQSKDIREALDVPFMVCRLCFEAIKLCPPLIKKGNPNLASDVAVAAVLLESAFTSANFNVEINLKYLKEEDFSVKVKRELKIKAKRVRKIRQQTEGQVGKIIRG